MNQLERPERMSLEDPTLGEISRRITAMEKKLDLVYERQLASPTCPSPGACLNLAEAVKVIGGRLDHLEDKKIDALEKEVDAIKLWQGRIAGGLSVLILLVGIFGPALRHAFGIE